MRPSCLILIVLSGLAGAVRAQGYEVVYRPPDARYRVLDTPGFEIVFQEGIEGLAREAAAVLAEELPEARRLVGLRGRFHLPVVLNDFNDLSNGFVSPYPFRSEIEGANVKGKILSPREPSWIAGVATHELMHAVQAEVRPLVGVAGLASLTGRDVGRIFNFLAPPGFSEGAAVYFESAAGAGRLNHSFFNMAFRAAAAEDPWTLSQVLHAPAYTRPFDRYYVGGAHFFDFLMRRPGPDVYRRTVEAYSRWPFFGFGAALQQGARRTARRLNREFRAEARAREAERQAALGPLTEPRILAGAPGLVHRRPRWLDDATLVAYVSGYDVRPGFYRVDAASGRRSRIAGEAITEDYYYSLDPARQQIVFARYRPDLTVATRAVADLFRLDLRSGEAVRLTEDARLFAPVPAPGGDALWALQNVDQFARWVRVEAGGAVQPLSRFRRADFKEIAPSPAGGPAAVLLNARGRQGLFRAEPDAEAPGGVRLEPWVHFARGAVYDPAWSADGRFLLFTADPDGVMNVYALDTEADRVLRLTNVPFGAFEAALSPDAGTVAFVHYRHERMELAAVPFRPEEAEEVPRDSTRLGPGLPWAEWLDEPHRAPYAGGTTRPYRPFRYLRRPRIVTPIYTARPGSLRPGRDQLGWGAGLQAQGTDVLGQWAYAAGLFYRARRLWTDLSVQTGLFPMRPSLRVYDWPIVQPLLLDGTTPGHTLLGDRGVSAGVSLPLLIEANVFRTAAFLAMEARYRSIRLMEPLPQDPGFASDRVTLRPSASFQYRVQRNPRDLIPNTGLVAYGLAEVDAWSGRGDAGRVVVAGVDAYLPVWLRKHHGLRLSAGLLAQSDGAIYDLSPYLPRGYDGPGYLGSGTFARAGFEYVLPLRYLDEGLSLVPLYFDALYAFGFAETVTPVSGGQDAISTAGAGLALQLTVLHRLNLELRLALAGRLEDGKWRVRVM